MGCEMNENVGFLISVASYVPESSYEDVVEDFNAAKFPVLLERRDPQVFAALQYLMPTAVVVYLLKPYFEKFLSRMAEDHYDLCKVGVKKLWSRFASKDRSIVSHAIGTEGKIFETDLALELSLVALSADQQRFSLLFPRSVSESEFEKAVSAFYLLIDQYDRDFQKLDPGRIASFGHMKHSPRVLTWSSSLERLVEVDVLESNRQKKLVTSEIARLNG